MTEDQDNAGDVVAATVRVALTAAGQLAEQAARRREAALRNAERTSAAQVDTLQAQLAGERQLARHAVRDVLQSGSKASVEQVVWAWQQIRGWDDPVTAADRDRLRHVVHDRFGVDPDSLSSDRKASSSPAPAQNGDTQAVFSVLAYDTAGSRDGSENRALDVGDSGAALSEPLADAEIDAEVAEASALAAQSHPTSPALATQRPADSPRARRRVGTRRAGVEVQSPGR